MKIEQQYRKDLESAEKDYKAGRITKKERNLLIDLAKSRLRKYVRETK